MPRAGRLVGVVGGVLPAVVVGFADDEIDQSLFFAESEYFTDLGSPTENEVSAVEEDGLFGNGDNQATFGSGGGLVPDDKICIMNAAYPGTAFIYICSLWCSMVPIYSYRRYSDKRQGKGDSNRRQKDEAKRWIDEWLAKHPDHYLDTTLHDDGRTAHRAKDGKFKGTNLDPEKGALGKFVAACKQGNMKPGILVFDHQDRFSRLPPSRQYPVLCELVHEYRMKLVFLTPVARIIDADNIDSMEICFEIMLGAQLAWRSSVDKSIMRKRTWDGFLKAVREGTAKKTGVCPAWLEPNDDQTDYRFIPEAKRAVQLIVRMALEGKGVTQITRYLNQHIQPIGRSEKWDRSYVHRILTNPALIGCYQPRANTRHPVGDPIPGYYPPICTEDEFHRIHATLTSRRFCRGPKQDNFANLFTHLIKDAADGAEMIRVSRSSAGKPYVYLCNANAHGGKGGSLHSCNYNLFERLFLRFVRELKVEDVMGTDEGQSIDNDIEAIRGSLSDVEERIAKAEHAILEDGDFEAMKRVLKQLERKRQDLRESLERLQIEAARCRDAHLTDTQKLIELLESTEDEELLELRGRIKAKIRQLVSQMWYLKIGTWVLLQIHFHSGGIRKFCIMPKSKLAMGRVHQQATLKPQEDLRNYRNWPGEKTSKMSEKYFDTIEREFIRLD